MVACRGCVSPVWERQRAKGQRREKNIWEVVRHRRFFSSAMSPVDTWVSVNGAAIQKHLQECNFNDKNIPAKPQVSKLFKAELKARVDLKKKI